MESTVDGATGTAERQPSENGHRGPHPAVVATSTGRRTGRAAGARHELVALAISAVLAGCGTSTTRPDDSDRGPYPQHADA